MRACQEREREEEGAHSFHGKSCLLVGGGPENVNKSRWLDGNAEGEVCRAGYQEREASPSGWHFVGT